MSGRVEVCVDGVWGTIARTWTPLTSRVICGQLGYSNKRKCCLNYLLLPCLSLSLSLSPFIVTCLIICFCLCIVAFAIPVSPGSGPVAFLYISCTGDEPSIFNCTTYRAPASYVFHRFDGGVRCFNETGSTYRNYCTKNYYYLINAIF